MEVHFSSVASCVSVVSVSLNHHLVERALFSAGKWFNFCSTFKRKNLRVKRSLSLSLSLSQARGVCPSTEKSFFLSSKSVVEGKTRVTYTRTSITERKNSFIPGED